MSERHDLASRHPDSRYVGWAIGVSAVLHGVMLAIFVVLSFLEPAKLDIAQKPVSARLVRLGQKRDEHLLPRKISDATSAADRVHGSAAGRHQRPRPSGEVRQRAERAPQRRGPPPRFLPRFRQDHLQEAGAGRRRSRG